jgi:hypothetical protein
MLALVTRQLAGVSPVPPFKDFGIPIPARRGNKKEQICDLAHRYFARAEANIPLPDVVRRRGEAIDAAKKPHRSYRSLRDRVDARRISRSSGECRPAPAAGMRRRRKARIRQRQKAKPAAKPV